MSLELVTIPALSDNYAFLVHDGASGRTALIDAPEVAPIESALSERGWGLDEIWLTHHHADHVDGADALRATYGSTVYGASADAHRLPALDRGLAGGERTALCGADCDVLEVSGHTIGHLAFSLPAEKLIFTADSLMALGCGRLFEGNGPQMWESLLKLRALPDDVTVCSGHEYTQANARFALTIEPGNAALVARVAEIDEARAAGRPTVPSNLGVEKATNPFLRADEPGIAAHLGLSGASPAEVFTEVRARKDKF